MATNRNKTNTASTQAKAENVPAADRDAVANSEIESIVHTEPAESGGKIKVRDIDPHTLVNVRNGFQGMLVYISKRTGETYVWEEFGADQEMELQELKNAKTSSKRFFTDNWFMFDEDWVIDYLGVRPLYKHALALDSFDSLFSKSPEMIEAEIAKLSNGQKGSLAYRARQLIANGQIDSRKAIAALERALGVALVEQ